MLGIAVLFGVAIGSMRPSEALLAPALVLAMLVIVGLSRRPALAVSGLFVLMALSEDTPSDLLGSTNSLFNQLGTLRLSFADIAVLGTFGVVVIAHRAVPRLSPGLTLTTTLFGAALAVGLIMGVTEHGTGVVVDAKTSFYFVLVPAIVLFGVSERSLQRVPRLILALGFIKGLLGIANVVTGHGYHISGITVSYYEPASNLLTLVAALVGIVTLVRGRRDPLAIATIFVTLPSLYLSQRRSFWIAAVLGVILLAIYLAESHRDVLTIASASAVALALLAVLVVGGGDFTFINTSAGSEYGTLHGAIGDDYRNAERTNVFYNIEQAPLTGLGFGVPWTQVDPLPGYFPDNRQYTHIGYLWVWLKMGILGLLAYLAFLSIGLRYAIRIYRHHARSDMRDFAAVLAIGLVADIVVEFTADFVGSDARYTFLVAAIVAWLSAVDYHLSSSRIRAAR